jgi:hypothetical protein
MVVMVRSLVAKGQVNSLPAVSGRPSRAITAMA